MDNVFFDLIKKNLKIEILVSRAKKRYSMRSHLDC